MKDELFINICYKEGLANAEGSCIFMPHRH